MGKKPRKSRATPGARKRAGRQVWAQIQEDARVSLPDVRRLRYFGLVSDALKPLASQAELELGDLLADKGDSVTAAERAVLEDFARLGLLLRAEFARYLETQDATAASRVNGLAGQRRAALQAVGMERRAKEIDLASYIEGKAEP